MPEEARPGRHSRLVRPNAFPSNETTTTMISSASSPSCEPSTRGAARLLYLPTKRPRVAAALIVGCPPQRAVLVVPRPPHRITSYLPRLLSGRGASPPAAIAAAAGPLHGLTASSRVHRPVVAVVTATMMRNLHGVRGGKKEEEFDNILTSAVNKSTRSSPPPLRAPPQK